ncbi:MAG: hypothetical protein JWP13_405 [Candidatus Saccharibacteria bacterium]|nr:hypothetical protein [Candidatus Saccharibacteria bacterium]
MQKVLIISNIKDEARSLQRPVVQKFMDGINASHDNLHLSFCAVQELIFTVTDGIPGIQLQGNELKDVYTVFHLRNANMFPDYASALQLYCGHYGIRFINEGDSNMSYFGKVSQGLLYAINGIPTPDFVSSPRNSNLFAYLETHAPVYPFILKHNNGIKGKDNYLIQDKKQLEKILLQENQGYVAQPFIRNKGELRVLTFGPDMIPMVFQKTAVAGTHLNNTSQGGEAIEIDARNVDPAIIETAKKAAKLTKRTIAGVDVLLANDGSWCILETNSTPSLASGVMVDKKQRFYSEYLLSLGKEMQ